MACLDKAKQCPQDHGPSPQSLLPAAPSCPGLGWSIPERASISSLGPALCPEDTQPQHCSHCLPGQPGTSGRSHCGLPDHPPTHSLCGQGFFPRRRVKSGSASGQPYTLTRPTPDPSSLCPSVRVDLQSLRRDRGPAQEPGVGQGWGSSPSQHSPAPPAPRSTPDTPGSGQG